MMLIQIEFSIIVFFSCRSRVTVTAFVNIFILVHKLQQIFVNLTSTNIYNIININITLIQNIFLYTTNYQLQKQ